MRAGGLHRAERGLITTRLTPEVALPARPGNQRLPHIHRNVPGVLSEINKVFASNGINIASQYLQTD